MNLENGIWIDAPPEKVWARLVDFERATDIVPFLEGAEVLGPGPLGAGSKLRLKAAYGGRAVTTDATIATFEPPRRLTANAAMAPMGLQVDLGWNLTPERGGTRLDQRVGVEFTSFMGRVAAKPLLGRLRSSGEIERGLARLKAAVEAEGRAP